MRFGMSATRMAQLRSRRFPPAISRRPGLRQRRSTGPRLKAASSCVARLRSRIFGRLTESSGLPDLGHGVALRAKPLDEAGLARKMQRAHGDERAAGGEKRRSALGHGCVAALK